MRNHDRIRKLALVSIKLALILLLPVAVPIFMLLVAHARLDSGRLPQLAFEYLARLIAQFSYELFVVRRNPNKAQWEVMLPERPKNDIFWAGLLHAIGTVLYMLGGSEGMINRLTREAGEQIDPSQWIHVGEHFTEGPYSQNEDEELLRERGAAGHVLKIWVVDYNPEDARPFYAIDNLPENLVIPHHREMLKKVSAHLQTYGANVACDCNRIC